MVLLYMEILLFILWVFKDLKLMYVKQLVYTEPLNSESYRGWGEM